MDYPSTLKNPFVSKNKYTYFYNTKKKIKDESSIYNLDKGDVYMKINPDDRRDNVDRIQSNIDNTIENIHLADEMIEKVSDPKEKKDLKEKNCRREKAVEGFKSEIKDEALAKKNNYK